MERDTTMKIEFRDVQPAIDRDRILEFHCFNNYKSETLFARSVSYDEYRKNWLDSPQPEQVLLSIETDLDDIRNIVQFVLIDDKIAGFLWVKFEDCDMKMLDTYMTIASIYDLGFLPEYQKQGVGTEILSHIEREARKRGATLIRSGAGSVNIASQKLHEKCGFEVYQVLYEKEV